MDGLKNLSSASISWHLFKSAAKQSCLRLAQTCSQLLGNTVKLRHASHSATGQGGCIASNRVHMLLVLDPLCPCTPSLKHQFCFLSMLGFTKVFAMAKFQRSQCPDLIINVWFLGTMVTAWMLLVQCCDDKLIEMVHMLLDVLIPSWDLIVHHFSLQARSAQVRSFKSFL